MTPEEKRLVDDLLSLAQIETQVKKMYAMADVLRWRGDAELSAALYKSADAIEAALAPIQRHTDEAAALVNHAKAIITKLNESGVAVERRMLGAERLLKTWQGIAKTRDQIIALQGNVIDAASATLEQRPCPEPFASMGHENHGEGGCDVHRRHMLRGALDAYDASHTGEQPEHDCNRDHPDADVYHPQPGDWSERFRGGMLK